MGQAVAGLYPEQKSAIVITKGCKGFFRPIWLSGERYLPPARIRLLTLFCFFPGTLLEKDHLQFS